MLVDYTLLGNDDRYRMLQARLRQYETRHFDAVMNLQMAQATGDAGRAKELGKQIADLETCAKIVAADLAKLSPPDPAAPVERARRHGSK